MNLYSQDPISSEISEINDRLANDNSNEWIEKETFNFSYNTDTLYITHLRILRNISSETYNYSLPIKNIKSVKAEYSEMFKNNTLTFISKSKELAFGQTLTGGEVLESPWTTYILVFSKKDMNEYKQIENLISEHPMFTQD